jgi:hypothetical protein
MQVFEGVLVTYICPMSESLSKNTHKEHFTLVDSMAKGKALRHDGIPIEFFLIALANSW